MRRFTPLELAIGAALVGSVLAVAVPTFVHELHASRFVEPADGLSRIGIAAVSFCEANERFPVSAPLTPSAPPRGRKETDPPGTWDGPTWSALAFRPAPDGVPHAYSFSFESPGGSTFVAQARGDLDGDGLLSTFEVRGEQRRTSDGKPGVTPGMYVEAEIE